MPEASCEDLPSGKRIIRHFDESGALVSEMHAYEALDIAIQIDYANGAKVNETYFSKRRLVTRKTYEKARAAYSDMPPADASLEDENAELLRALARERREKARAARARVPDPEQARAHDAFCEELMAQGAHEDAGPWLESRSHTLGEKTSAASRKVVERLEGLGCVRIVACDIQDEGDACENTGHLVVELPEDASARAAIFKQLTRMARALGYDGTPDDGQRYAYIKLD
ncbi:MAG: hypothetical protein JXR94_06615 [Candidatus Hydrogenedentes bacterium]|nr:hypothetical protein [Candidatus Hydrogenedentota bacterium]